MEKILTHTQINSGLCGRPVDTKNGGSQVVLETTSDMAVDSYGLVHGGFIFGLADYAAMIAVNDPNVVLGSANVKFLGPVRAGQIVVADAETLRIDGKKHIVFVTAHAGETKIFEGEFVCFVLKTHVLS